MSQPVPLPIRMAGVGHEFGADGVRVRALDGIDLEVAPGELLAVMGPSGSGKSTLLSIAGGLERPTHGSVFINGVDMATMDAAHRAEVRRRSIGYVFQDYNLIPSLSALENVEMPLQLDGVSPSGLPSKRSASPSSLIDSPSVSRVVSASALRSPEASWVTARSFLRMSRRVRSTRTRATRSCWCCVTTLMRAQPVSSLLMRPEWPHGRTAQSSSATVASSTARAETR